MSFRASIIAAAEGQTEVVRLLVDHRADPTVDYVDRGTAESYARPKGHRAVVELLENRTPPGRPRN